MKNTHLLSVTTGLLLTICCQICFASEIDELRERAAAMKKEAFALAQRGQKEQAEQVNRKAVDLLEAAERMELKGKGQEEPAALEKQMRGFAERLQDLVAKERKMREVNAPDQELAEVREQISNTERQLKKMQVRVQAQQIEAATRRIHHIRVAAENLKMAEVHDLARQLMEQAEVMERDVRHAKERLAAGMREGQERPADSVGNVVQDLRAEVERLRAEVNELRQRVGSR